MLKEYAIQILLPSAAFVVAFVASKALYYVANYFKAKAAATEDGTLKDRLYMSLETLAGCAADAVLVVESKLRPEVKAAAADGKISPEEGAKLKAAAMEIAKAQAQAMLPKVAEAAGMGALDDILAHLVEAAAAKLAGNSRGAPVPR